MKKILLGLVICLFVLVVIYFVIPSEISYHGNYYTQIVKRYTANQDGPVELIVENKSKTENAMTEIRAIADRCAMDFGATGSNLNLSHDKTIQANHGFLVSESSCNGMTIKANRGPIQFKTISDEFPLKVFSIDNGLLRLPVNPYGFCQELDYRELKDVVLCANDRGEIFVASSKGIKRLL